MFRTGNLLSKDSSVLRQKRFSFKIWPELNLTRLFKAKAGPEFCGLRQIRRKYNSPTLQFIKITTDQNYNSSKLQFIKITTNQNYNESKLQFANIIIHQLIINA